MLEASLRKLVLWSRTKLANHEVVDEEVPVSCIFSILNATVDTSAILVEVVCWTMVVVILNGAVVVKPVVVKVVVASIVVDHVGNVLNTCL